MANRSTFALNKTVKKPTTKLVVNEAGGVVHKDISGRDLMVLAGSFRPRNSYYNTAEEQLTLIENAVRDLAAKGKLHEALTIAWHLGAECGVRLAPAIIATYIAANNNCVLNAQEVKELRTLVLDVFTRPDFIANALGYFKYKNPGAKSFLAAPKEYLGMLREALENMPTHTLRAQKMRRRQIKLKNLIIGLRPKPKTDELSVVYKHIIEDGPLSKLKVMKTEGGKVRAEKLVSVLSDTSLATEEKQEFIEENVKRLPIMELIRNFNNIPAAQVPEIVTRLTEILEDPFKARVINPFELMLPIDSIPAAFGDALNKLVQKHVCLGSVGADFDEIIILLDSSGSMHGLGRENAAKILAVLSNAVADVRTSVYAFDTQVVNITNNAKLIQRNNTKTPLNSVKDYTLLNTGLDGWTAVLDCTEKILSRHSGAKKAVILLTDEESWADNHFITAYDKLLSKHGAAGSTVVINCSPGSGTVFKPSANSMRVAGLHQGTLLALKQGLFWNEYLKLIEERFAARVKARN